MNTVAFRVDDGKLFIGDKWIDLPYTVGDVVECNDSLFVRVEPPTDVIFNRNIFAITRTGEVLWQIAESPHGTEADKPYVGIFRDIDGCLVAANWNGVDYSIDCESGGIATKAFNK